MIGDCGLFDIVGSCISFYQDLQGAWKTGAHSYSFRLYKILLTTCFYGSCQNQNKQLKLKKTGVESWNRRLDQVQDLDLFDHFWLRYDNEITSRPLKVFSATFDKLSSWWHHQGEIEKPAKFADRSSSKSSFHRRKIDQTRFKIWTRLTTSGRGMITKLHPDLWKSSVQLLINFQVGSIIRERSRSLQSLPTDRVPRAAVLAEKPTRPGSRFGLVWLLLVQVR